MDISVVIPLLNERDSLKELHDWIVSVMLSNQFSYEILFIDDGSTDKSWQIISELGEINPKVKGIQFLKNFGKSQALHAGLANAE
jgi:glycosyltransferase involved in cell wall biosynthesis